MFAPPQHTHTHTHTHTLLSAKLIKNTLKVQVVELTAFYILHIQSMSLSRAEVKLFKCEESVASFLATQTFALTYIIFYFYKLQRNFLYVDCLDELYKLRT